MAVEVKTSRFHPLPVIGHPDTFYVKHIQLADQTGDVHAREGHKVGRYVTLAMDPMMAWDEKLRHFAHALKRHCVPPAGATPDVEQFYERLGELVRRQAGQEAVRMVVRESDALLKQRQQMDEAEFHEQVEILRRHIFGDSTSFPTWISSDAFDQVNRMLTRLG